MMLYRRIDNPKEGEMIQFLGIYATRWPWDSGVKPTVAFVETEALGNLLDEAIGLYLEFKDQHGYDPQRARAAAVFEVLEGLDALEDIALMEQEQARAAVARARGERSEDDDL